MKLVWPDSFVEEANLSQTIFVLRKTLGDDADGRPFIDTVPRRGYRFAAPVVEHVADMPSMAAVPHGNRLVKRGAIAAVLVLVAAAVAWRGLSSRQLPTADPASGKTRVAVLPFEN